MGHKTSSASLTMLHHGPFSFHPINPPPHRLNTLFNLLATRAPSSLVPRHTAHSPLPTLSPVTLDRNLPQCSAQGDVPTGISPTRREHVAQMMVLRMMVHILYRTTSRSSSSTSTSTSNCCCCCTPVNDGLPGELVVQMKTKSDP